MAPVKNINFPCLKQTISAYTDNCGSLEEYGLKYVRAFAIGRFSFLSELNNKDVDYLIKEGIHNIYVYIYKFLFYYCLNLSSLCS